VGGCERQAGASAHLQGVNELAQVIARGFACDVAWALRGAFKSTREARDAFTRRCGASEGEWEDLSKRQKHLSDLREHLSARQELLHTREEKMKLA
jgi:hypothetical protein